MASSKLLSTAAIALIVGTGVAMAQPTSDTLQKREQSPRAQAPKDESPPAGEQRQKDRTAQQPAARDNAKDSPNPPSKETQRGDDKSGPQRQQAQEPSQNRDANQSTKSQDSTRDQRGATQQRDDDQKAREAKQPTEQKQQQSRDQQQKQDDRAAGSKEPSGTKEQRTQTQPPAQNNQASQPARQDNTAQNPPTGRDQTANQQSGSTSINTEQRTQIRQELSRDRAAISRETRDLNIQVNIGAQLPPRVRPRPLPPDIVQIAPQYRGYEYTIVEDEIVIVEPRTRKVVEVIDESGRGPGTASRAGSQRVTITDDQRQTLKQAVRRTSSTTGSTSQGAALDLNCLTLQAVPEELTRANPEFGNYKMLAVGEQVILVDPREQKVVEVVE